MTLIHPETRKHTASLMSKAANDMADGLPLLHRPPYRTLAAALGWTPSFLKAAALAFPRSTPAQRVRLAVKLASHAVKRARAEKAEKQAHELIGYIGPGRSPLATTTPMTYNGPPRGGSSTGNGSVTTNPVKAAAVAPKQPSPSPSPRMMGAAGGLMAGMPHTSPMSGTAKPPYLGTALGQMGGQQSPLGKPGIAGGMMGGMMGDMMGGLGR